VTAAVVLADVERRLTIFASGISGRHYEIEALPDTVADDRTTSLAPHPDVVYLPSRCTTFAERAHNLGAYRVMVLHQIGYREFGSYAFRIDAARAQSAVLAARSPPQQTLRESDFATLFRHFSRPGLARHLFGVLEAHRVDCRIAQTYPGIVAHQRRVAAEALDRRGELPLDPLLCVLESLVRWTLGAGVEVLTDADATGTIATVLEAATAVATPDADVYATADALACIFATIEHAGLLPTAELEGAISAAEDAELLGLDRPDFNGDGPEDWLQREARLADWMAELAAMDARIDEAERGETGGDGTPRPAEGLRALIDARDTFARRADMERASVSSAIDPDQSRGRRRFWYDEWDAHHARYLPRWCRVFEERLDDGDSGDLGALLRRIAAHRARVREQFADLPLEALARERHIVDGEDLDPDALVRYVVDRRRRDVPDERVYERRERALRDVAAAFLVDLSASTDDPTEKSPTEPPPPTSPGLVNLRDPYDDDGYLWSKDRQRDAEEPKRRIVDVLRESLTLMAAGLHDYGDAFGIFGFSGYGRLCVEYFVAKDFREPWTAMTLRALAAMKPRRSTRMGPAIRHTVHKLAATGAGLKVMIVLSDGFPQDCDYGPDRGDHAYGVADTARALREAEMRGIKTFCLTVDRSGHDYLKEMCPDERYLVIDDIEALPEALAKVYRRLTGSG
jgi:nitric oxide reductase NorD protein